LYQNPILIFLLQMKTQFKFILTLFVCSFLATNTFAQNDNFKNGYIITNQGDTVFGQIDLRTNLINQSQCRFRADEKAQSVVYMPFDIKSYFFTDDKLYFVSKTIEIDKTKINTFIEFLVNGVMNLYYYEFKTVKYNTLPDYQNFDGIISYYFFEDQAGKMFAVYQKPSPDYILRYDNSYKNLTNFVLRDANISQDINKMQFNQKSFINITKNYHNAICMDGTQCIIYQNINPDKFGAVFKISPLIGYNFYNFSDNYNFGTYTKTLNYNGSFPTLGVELQFLNPRFTRFFGLQAELSISQLKIDKYSKTFEVNYPYFPNETVTVNQDAISLFFGKIKFGFLGIYPKYKFQPIAGYGLYAMTGFDYGGSLTLGFDYQLNTKHSLIFRANYDTSFVPKFLISASTFSVCSAKIGFSF